MRKDLQKQLCEQERYGSSRRFKEVRRKKDFNIEDDEFIAGREGMRKRYVVAGINKEFSENFSPLWGVIRKNVNRLWDDVFSELNEVFDMRSHVNAHIIVHLFDFVEVNTYMEDGEVWVRGYRHQPLTESGSEYFVHPKTGILLKNPNPRNWNSFVRERRAKDAVDALKLCRPIDATHELRRRDEDSPWFVCTIERLPYPSMIRLSHVGYAGKVREYNGYPECYVNDRWTGQRARWGQIVCTHFRTASKKDLKNAGAK